MTSKKKIESSANVPEISPTISVDCAIFGYEDYRLKVLTKREIVPSEFNPNYEWKLPGNRVRLDEDICVAASRILKEQTGLENLSVKPFSVFSDPNRLKRREHDYEWIKPSLEDERVITIAFYSLVNVSAIDNSVLNEDASWVVAYDIKELMFDHKEVLDEALKKLRYDLLHEPLVFELLPEKFTLTQMQRLYEAIYNTTYDKRNFRRKIPKMPYIIPLYEIETEVAHTPVHLFSFNREVYEKKHTERFDFEV
jgi:8-oxo-dGTP diphosphatase